MPESASPRILVVGAGPAGIAAADTLAGRGLRPVVIDEGIRAGGQGYRKSDPALGLDLSYAGQPAYRRIHGLFDALKDKVDYRPETSVWSVDAGNAYTASRGQVNSEALAFDRLILATGATDKIAPVPGWTLPGVFSLGGAQVLLKDQGCAIGEKVVFYGSSPLLYLAAAQYLEAGAGKVTILDTTGFADKFKAGMRIARAPDVFRQGMSLLVQLRLRGVTVHHGVSGLEIDGDGHVKRVRFRVRGRDHRLDCDAVAIGHGLRSETQLAELAGCEFAYSETFDQWLPKTDPQGRSGTGVYLAGDGVRIGGAVAAELSGRLAAMACLADLGLEVSPQEVEQLQRKRDSYFDAQDGLADAFAWPRDELAALADDVVLCRCENVTAGTVREVAREMKGVSDINRIKALTRCGMGRCQSRMCGLAAIAVAAEARREPPERLTHYRVQPPIKPVFIPPTASKEG